MSFSISHTFLSFSLFSITPSVRLRCEFVGAGNDLKCKSSSCSPRNSKSHPIQASSSKLNCSHSSQHCYYHAHNPKSSILWWRTPRFELVAGGFVIQTIVWRPKTWPWRARSHGEVTKRLAPVTQIGLVLKKAWLRRPPPLMKLLVMDTKKNHSVSVTSSSIASSVARVAFPKIKELRSPWFFWSVLMGLLGWWGFDRCRGCWWVDGFGIDDRLMVVHGGVVVVVASCFCFYLGFGIYYFNE